MGGKSYSWSSLWSGYNQTDPEDILDFEKRVDAITTEDLKKAAEKYFTWNNYLKAVLYPEIYEYKNKLWKEDFLF